MKISTPYEMIGGEQTLLNLVDRFYFYMDTLPEAQGIRAIHQHNLASAKDTHISTLPNSTNQRQYLCQWKISAETVNGKNIESKTKLTGRSTNG